MLEKNLIILRAKQKMIFILKIIFRIDWNAAQGKSRYILYSLSFFFVSIFRR